MVYKVDNNGMQIGDFTRYEKGCVSFVQSFDDIFCNRDFNRIMNHVKGERMEIYSHVSGNRIYHGEFNEKREREGWGIEYDEESGRMLLEGKWKNNKLVEIIRKIEGNIMIEFKWNGDNTIVSNRIPLYVGEFVYDELKESFIRNGIGYLIDEESRIATRECEWKDGKEVSGRDLIDGWYTPSPTPKPKPMSKPVVDPKKEEEKERKKREEEEEKERKRREAEKKVAPAPTKVRIAGSAELGNLNLQVKDLTICSNCCKDLTALDVNRFEWLRSIEIGDDCFGSVKTFQMDGLNRLKSLKIGKNSFTQKKNDDGNDKSKSFHILNCESLKSIEIGEFSFSDFGGQFELKNLPSLQSIQIGTIGSWSRNFYYSSFVIRSILNDIEYVMIRSS